MTKLISRIILVMALSNAVFRFPRASTAEPPIPQLAGNWTPGDANNISLIRKNCDFPKMHGWATSVDQRKMSSPTSCANFCLVNTACSHFVFFNTTCYIKHMPRWLWPTEVYARRFSNMYTCGYIPTRLSSPAIYTARCTITTDFNKVSLPTGLFNLPERWLSILSNLVNMTLSLHVFGIPNNEIVRRRKPLYEAMKCIIGKDSLNAETLKNFKFCFTYINHPGCNYISPFNQDYVVDWCVYNRTFIVNSRGNTDIRTAKKVWISTSSLTSYHKSNAKRDLQRCVKKRMTPPPGLVEQIMTDRLLNKAMVKHFISTAMADGKVDYFFGAKPNVEKYFFSIQRMLCLVQSLLKHGCSRSEYKLFRQINQRG